MSKELETYNNSIAHSSVLSSIYVYMEGKNQPFDIKELLRAEYVMIVSAFDTYFHNCVLKRMLKMFNGEISASKAYESFDIPLEKVCLIINDDNPITRLEIIQNTIREINQKDSYQSSRSIEYAMSLIGKTGIWSYLSQRINLPAEDVKMKLNMIIRRRNQIAHESDINFTNNEKNNIEIDDVNYAKEYLSQIVSIIDNWLEKA